MELRSVGRPRVAVVKLGKCRFPVRDPECGRGGDTTGDGAFNGPHQFYDHKMGTVMPHAMTRMSLVQETF